MSAGASKQSPAERLFTLTCCLMAAPIIGLSKNDIFRSVVSYAEQGSDLAKEKMFDRDKSDLREMGVQLEVIDSSSFDETDSSRYRIAKGSFDWPADFEINNEHMTLLELAAKAWNNQLLSKQAQASAVRPYKAALAGDCGVLKAAVCLYTSVIGTAGKFRTTWRCYRGGKARQIQLPQNRWNHFGPRGDAPEA